MKFRLLSDSDLVAPKKLTRKGLIAGAAPLLVAGPLAKLALADNPAEHDHLQLASHTGHGQAAQGHAAMIGEQAPAVGGPRDLDAVLYPPKPLPYRRGVPQGPGDHAPPLGGRGDGGAVGRGEQA